MHMIACVCMFASAGLCDCVRVNVCVSVCTSECVCMCMHIILRFHKLLAITHTHEHYNMYLQSHAAC